MLRNINRRAAVVGTTLAALAAFGAGTASAASTQTADMCGFVPGNVCYMTADQPGAANLIPGGEPRTFSPAVDITSISNGTGNTQYCVSADVNFSIGPGQEIDLPHNTVMSMTTVSIDTVCPT
ncbi:MULTISPECIES: hypothetical protein [unclassified Streptomyces]|nr:MULTISPECIES: hypothetical protein [unclassified Streptomyces]WSD94635.1 hypothetical protein OG758_11040 [Streptomyces sp. NBC_01474]